jgi:NAD(P)-dependent dehydrogenase (short-subunit alcohol dehydrogenase family)
MRLRQLAGLAAVGALAAWGVTGSREARPRSLRGQVVLMTGGSSGLGLSLACALAAQGCRIALCARDADELTQAQIALTAAVPGVKVMVVPCDTADRVDVELMVARVTDRFGPIDGVVNVAGVVQGGPLESLTIQDFEEVMQLNFFGALYATYAVLPRMIAQKRGWIANIDATGDRLTAPGGRLAVQRSMPYNCSRFALRGFSESLDIEVAKHGIAVTTVLPGLMRTGGYPGLSLSSRAAARRIVDAIQRGKRELTLGLPAKIEGLIHDLFPGLTLAALEQVDRLLPRSPKVATSLLTGRNLEETSMGPLERAGAGFDRQFSESAWRLDPHR